MTAFADLVRAGKVLYIGVSEWTAEQIIAAAAALARELKVPLVSNQPQYSMLWRVIEEQVVPTCERGRRRRRSSGPRSRRACSPASTCPASSRPPAPAPPTARSAARSQGFLTDDVLTRVQKLRPIADDLGLSMAQLAVAWVLQNRNVAAAIIGATRPEQVRDNVKAAGVKLDDEVLRADRRRPRRRRRARPRQDPAGLSGGEGRGNRALPPLPQVAASPIGP